METLTAIPRDPDRAQERCDACGHAPAETEWFERLGARICTGCYETLLADMSDDGWNGLVEDDDDV